MKWRLTAEQHPERKDGDEAGLVWIDDGLQVTTCYWSRVPEVGYEYWQPRTPRVRPPRAKRLPE
jgi:hypothetical protein